MLWTQCWDYWTWCWLCSSWDGLDGSARPDGSCGGWGWWRSPLCLPQADSSSRCLLCCLSFRQRHSSMPFHRRERSCLLSACLQWDQPQLANHPRTALAADLAEEFLLDVQAVIGAWHVCDALTNGRCSSRACSPICVIWSKSLLPSDYLWTTRGLEVVLLLAAFADRL